MKDVDKELKLLNDKFEKARKAILEQHNKIQPIENELLSNREDYFQVRQSVNDIRTEFNKLKMIEDVEEFLADNVKENFIKKAMGSIDEEMIYNRIQVRYNKDIAELRDMYRNHEAHLDGLKQGFERGAMEVRTLKLENKELKEKNELILKTLQNIIKKEEDRQKKTVAFFLKSCYTKLRNLFSAR